MTETRYRLETDEIDDALRDVVNAWMEAWNEADPQRRRELISKAWVADGRYVDPFLAVDGLDEIADALGKLRVMFPGHSVHRRSGVEAFFGQVRFAWEFLDPKGSFVTDGVDVAEVAEDGRFRHLTGFVGQVVPVPLEGSSP
ncbi:MAG TPA: nuclear transport factor 2 family protein [Acidimicrobiales bacterium]|nr:nuclear transport factor 2 family protein [Acidimicrobiales bacterium]